MSRHIGMFILCAVLLIYTGCTFCGEVRRLQVIHQPSLGNLFIGGRYFLRSISGIKVLMDCVLQCAQVQTCVFMTFHKGTTQCRFYETSLFSHEDTTNSNGWEAYRFGDPSCPLQERFMYSRKFNMCLLYTVLKRNYTDSDAYCRSKGAEHVMLNPVEKRRALGDILELTTPWLSMWLGATYRNARWEWMNGEPVEGVVWKDNQPQCPQQSPAPCNCLVLEGARNWKVKVAACEEEHLVVCEYYA